MWVAGKKTVCDPSFTRAVRQRLEMSSSYNTTTMTVSRPFVRDYPGEPVPEETLTHPPS